MTTGKILVGGVQHGYKAFALCMLAKEHLQRLRRRSAAKETKQRGTRYNYRLRFAETRQDFLWRTGEVGLPKKARGSKGEGGPGLNIINLIDYSFYINMKNFMVLLRARWNYSGISSNFFGKRNWNLQFGEAPTS